jgi:hypothetical protein
VDLNSAWLVVGAGPQLINFVSLLLGSEMFPKDAVAVGFAGKCGGCWVFPAKVADGAGLVGGLTNGEVDAVSAPEGVFVGDYDDRLCPKFGAVGGDGVWNTGDCDREVEFLGGHGRASDNDDGARSNLA